LDAVAGTWKPNPPTISGFQNVPPPQADAHSTGIFWPGCSGPDSAGPAPNFPLFPQP